MNKLCLHCLTPLIPAYDDDPNGESNIVCIRCRNEEEHDFDVEPNAVFHRNGSILTPDETVIRRGV